MSLCIIDYTLITESPGLKATQEQIQRLYQRYHFARDFVKDREVLEVACGCGIGLGYLAKVAKKVIGIDIEEKNYNIACKLYNDTSNIQIHLMDAHDLKFSDNSFDLVLLYEAIYYLKEPQKFISEVERVLREDGELIICSVNKDWEDFHPSPYTHKYFSVPELYGILKDRFKEVTIYGGFPVDKGGVKSKVISLIKHIAVNLNLIPGNLKTRAYLKRFFMGRLLPLPEKLYEGMAACEPPVQILGDRVNKDFKIIYAMAKK